MNWIVILIGVFVTVVGACAEWQKNNPPTLKLETRPISRAYMPKTVLLNRTWKITVQDWDEVSIPGPETHIRIYGDIEDIRAGDPEPDVVIPSPYKGRIELGEDSKPLTFGPSTKERFFIASDGRQIPYTDHLAELRADNITHGPVVVLELPGGIENWIDRRGRLNTIDGPFLNKKENDK